MSADLSVASLRDQPPTLLIQLVAEAEMDAAEVKTRVEGVFPDMEEGQLSWKATSRRPRGELLSSSPGKYFDSANAVL